MGKRRTRKEKEWAKHQFSLSWVPFRQIRQAEPKKNTTEADVKRQFEKTSKPTNSKVIRSDLAVSSDKDINLTQIKRDIVRSLILAGVIVGLEVVLYLAWNV